MHCGTVYVYRCKWTRTRILYLHSDNICEECTSLLCTHLHICVCDERTDPLCTHVEIHVFDELTDLLCTHIHRHLRTHT